MHTEVGTVLKDLRLKRNISQKSIAEKVGLTQQAIALIENGKRKVDFDLFLKIVDVLDYPICDVINDIGYHITDDNQDKLCEYLNGIEYNAFISLLKNCDSSLEKLSCNTYRLTYKRSAVDLSQNDLYNLMDDIFYYSESVIRRFVQSKPHSSTDNIVEYSSAPKAARNNYINEPGEVEKTYEDISSLKRPE